jgi:hypothetical protein
MLQQLNDVFHMKNPTTDGVISRTDVELTKWEFWSDARSHEHVLFAAYKARQRKKRAQEEEDYTQQEIYSVLKWSEDMVGLAKAKMEECPQIDFTFGHVSQAFYNEKYHQQVEIHERWEHVLRPHLTFTVAEADDLD